MRNIFSFVIIILIFCVCTGEEIEESDDIPVVEGDGGTITTAVEDGVLILTKENFDIQTSSKDIILVEFYAPWCGHCKSLAPEYAKAAKMLQTEDPPIPLAKVDATIESDLAKRFDVQGFPTIFIFRKGKKYEYDGPRSAMGIVEYMKEQADPNWKPPPEVVLTLTNENFTDTITNAEIILVEFYAPWCGHCKRLAPEYERAAKLLKDLPIPIPLAKIDGTVEKELADKYEARGYPTLMIFRKGKKSPYNGPREEAGIVSYMKQQALPPSKEVTSTKSLKSSMNKKDLTVVGFFKSQDEALYKEYIESANNLREKFQFYHTFDDRIAQMYGTKANKIILYQPEIFASEYEKSQYEFSKESGSSDDITKFIKKHALPLVGERSQSSRWKYQDAYPLIVVYYDVDFSFEHRGRTQLVRKEVVKVAQKYKGKITFAVSNEEEFEEEMIMLGLDDSGEDVNAGYFENDKNRYRMEPVEEFSVEELQNFVENVLAGKIPRRIKSQPLPKVNKGPVITVVGSTFEDLVTKTAKHVLLEFYAPWCGHCKKLEPVYKKLGKAFESNDQLIIAKMDATANDYPGHFEVNGFPTIYFIHADHKDKPISFDGDRTLENLTQFVNNQLKSDKSTKEEL